MCFSHRPEPHSGAAFEGSPPLAFLRSHLRLEGGPMNLKEHISFLVMMIPTLLLLIAAIVTLAAGPIAVS